MYARDENDQDCLSYLLCWLHQLLYEESFSVNSPSEMQMLESLKNRSITQKQNDLIILCELKIARCYFENGHDPKLVFDALQCASEVLSKNYMENFKYKVILMRAAVNRGYGITTLK
jgi:hypothetical protein